MLVLGIDPGPTSNGYALLDFTISSAPVWFHGGKSTDMVQVFELLEESLNLRPSLVGIEQPRALHNPMANSQVLATAWAGGRAEGIAIARGYATFAVGVNEWRQALVGHSSKGDNVDHKVEAVLRRFVRQVPARTAVHARDAAGVACIAHRRWRLAVRPVLGARS